MLEVVEADGRVGSRHVPDDRFERGAGRELFDPAGLVWRVLRAARAHPRRRKGSGVRTERVEREVRVVTERVTEGDRAATDGPAKGVVIDVERHSRCGGTLRFRVHAA